MKRRGDRSTGELDVVELLTEDDDGDPTIAGNAEPEGAARPARRRWIVGVVAVVVALVAYSLTTGGDPKPDAATSTPATTAVPTPTTAAPRPEVAPGPFLDSLDSRFAFTQRNDVFVLDPVTAEIDRISGVSAAGVSVAGAANGSLLVSDQERHFVVESDGNVIALDDANVFPAANGMGWWRADDDTLTPIGFEADPVVLPPGTVAVAALRSGILTRHEEEPWGLSVWTPGGVAVDLPNSSAALVAAAHPDRIAWYGSCAESSCDLQVTDVASSRTVAVPGVLPLSSPGVATGKFSADGTRLALRVTDDQASEGELVVIDLAAGTVLLREPTGASATSSAATAFRSSTPFDFTTDGERLVVVDAVRTRSAQTVELATGRRVLGDNDLRAATSVVNIDRAWSVPGSALADPIPPPVDVVLAAVDIEASRLDLIDTTDGTRRSVDMRAYDVETRPSNGERWGPMIVSVARGFVVGDGTQAAWVPVDGEPRALGSAHLVMASSGRERAWLFTTRADEASYDVISVDGTTGETRAEDPVLTLPEAIVGDEFVRTIPASFDRSPRIELWNVRTGARRELDAGSGSMSTIATEHYVLWQDSFCYEGRDACSLHSVEIATGDRVDFDVNASTWGQNRVTGDVAYLQTVDGALVRIDTTTGAFAPVPGADQVNQWAVTPSDTVVFDGNGILYAWAPGLPNPLRLASTSPNSGTMFAAL